MLRLNPKPIPRVLRSTGASRILLAIILGHTYPARIASVLHLRAPTVIEGLSRLRDGGVVERGKRGKQQEYDVLYDELKELLLYDTLYPPEENEVKDKLREELLANLFTSVVLELYLRRLAEASGISSDLAKSEFTVSNMLEIFPVALSYAELPSGETLEPNLRSLSNTLHRWQNLLRRENLVWNAGHNVLPMILKELAKRPLPKKTEERIATDLNKKRLAIHHAKNQATQLGS